MKAFDITVFTKQLQRVLRKRAGASALSTFLRSVRHRLKDAGDTPLPATLETRRCLTRLGVLADMRENKKNDTICDDFCQRMGAAVGVDAVTASVWLRLFSAGQYGVVTEPVCGEVPDSINCPVADMCVYYAQKQNALLPGESPAERMADGGPGALTASELVSLVLGGGTNEGSALEKARILLAHFGSLHALAAATPNELEAANLSNHDVLRMRAALGMVERWTTESRRKGRQFQCGADFYEHYAPSMRDLKQERFLTVLLDTRNCWMSDHIVSEGTLTRTLVHPREVFRPAIRDAASAVAFVHNHPSGDPTPSEQDLSITERLLEAGRICGIRVVDHLIIGHNQFTSFAEEGLIS